MNKIAIFLSILFTIALVYLANVYNTSYEIKLIASERISYIQQAADNFSKYGFIICFASWILSNIVAIKETKKRWLLLPFLFAVILSIMITCQTEEIFKFKKEEGLLNGSFSVSYLIAFFTIGVSAIIIAINYFCLNYFLKKIKIIDNTTIWV